MQNIIQDAFNDWLSGASLRKIAKKYGIPKSTLADRFKSTYGNDYSKRRNHHGLLPIIEEYLNSPLLTSTQKRQLQGWLNQHKQQIIKTDNLDLKLYTERQISALTKIQCGHRSKDWRDIISDCKAA